MSNRKVVLILAFASLVRIYLVFFTYCATNDAWGYVQLAKYISSGDIDSALNHEQHPLYPCLVAISHFFVRDWVAAGQLVSVIFGTLTVIPAYFLTRKIFNENVALLTAVLFAIHPYMCRFSAEIITDSTYLFFFLSSVWLGYLGIEKDFHSFTAFKDRSNEDKKNGAESFFCGCGFLAGLAYLTRPEGGGVVLVLTCWLIIRAARRGLRYIKGVPSDLSWLDSTCLCATHGQARCLMYLLLSFALVSSLYLLDIRFRTGHWRPTKKKKMTEIVLPREGQLSKTDRVIKESQDVDKLKRALRGGPKKHKRYGPGAPYVYGAAAVLSEYAKTYHYLLVLFLILGLIRRKDDPQWKWRKGETYLLPFVLLYLAMIYGLAVSASYLSGRHTMSLVALSLCWGSVGILRTSEWTADKLRRVSMFKTAQRSLAFVMVLVLAFVIPKTLMPQRPDKLGLKVAGREIHQRGGPNAIILSDSTQVALYADGIHVGLSGAFLTKKRERRKKKVKIDVSYQAILNYAAEKNAKYLAVWTKHLQSILPDFRESARNDDRISLVFRVGEFGEARSLGDAGGENDIEVYEIVSEPQKKSKKGLLQKP